MKMLVWSLISQKVANFHIDDVFLETASKIHRLFRKGSNTLPPWLFKCISNYRVQSWIAKKKLLKAPNPPEGGGGRGPPKELYEQACVRNFIIVQWFIANRCKLFWSKLQIGTYASYDPYVCRKKKSCAVCIEYFEKMRNKLKNTLKNGKKKSIIPKERYGYQNRGFQAANTLVWLFLS